MNTLFKTKWGFNLQIAGANKHAAKYAGLNVKVWMVLDTLPGQRAPCPSQPHMRHRAFFAGIPDEPCRRLDVRCV